MSSLCCRSFEPICGPPGILKLPGEGGKMTTVAHASYRAVKISLTHHVSGELEQKQQQSCCFSSQRPIPKLLLLDGEAKEAWLATRLMREKMIWSSIQQNLSTHLTFTLCCAARRSAMPMYNSTFILLPAHRLQTSHATVSSIHHQLPSRVK